MPEPTVAMKNTEVASKLEMISVGLHSCEGAVNGLLERLPASPDNAGSPVAPVDDSTVSRRLTIINDRIRVLSANLIGIAKVV